MDLTGDMMIAAESLTVNFNAVNAATTVTHKGSYFNGKPAEVTK